MEIRQMAGKNIWRGNKILHTTFETIHKQGSCGRFKCMK